jgi:hypothetical protein
MAGYEVKYQSVRPGVTSSGVSSVILTANSEHEARQKFLSNHISTSTTKYKIIAVLKKHN